jgi:hypothetical protein
MKMRSFILPIIILVAAIFFILIKIGVFDNKGNSIKKTPMVNQENSFDFSQYPSTKSFKELLITRFNLKEGEDGPHGDLYEKSSWSELGLQYQYPVIPDVLVVQPEPRINSPARVFLKNNTYAEGESMGDIRLIKIDPKTLEPALTAVHGSRQSFVSWFQNVGEGGVFVSLPKTLDGYSLLQNVYLDSGNFYYDPNYYYMFIYSMVIPNPAGTPTDYMYTSNLFKILPEKK